MDDSTPDRVALTHPITDLEPELLKKLPIDNLVGGLTALASELYILRERMAIMEKELVRLRILAPDALENFQPNKLDAEEINAGLDAFVSRFWSELARGSMPKSRIDPQVDDYLGDPTS